MVDFQTARGGKTRIDDDKLEALRGALRGTLLMPADKGYDVSRTLWNAMIDRHPALIARCSGTADVVRAVSPEALAKLKDRAASRGGMGSGMGSGMGAGSQGTGAGMMSGL